jgi:hypothetical protein
MKNKNIIFLDIDGVLNCQLHYQSKQFKDYRDAKKKLRKQVKGGEIEWLEYYSSQICKERIQWFNALCEETNSDVVLSSTWRLGRELEELKQVFKYCGATFNLISKTPHCEHGVRGVEIYLWLKENITKEEYGCLYFDFYRYAIIDDDSDMLLNQANHFFQTDNYSGLTPSTCYRIKRFFTHETF